jgi:Xaa-Pro dipeptidase
MASVDEILATKYPAKAHARRVAQVLQDKHGDAGVVYLEAQKTRLIEDNDEAMPFRYVGKTSTSLFTLRLGPAGVRYAN